MEFSPSTRPPPPCVTPGNVDRDRENSNDMPNIHFETVPGIILNV